MAKINVTRTIRGMELRTLCIERNWYTRGNNEQYANLLVNLTKKYNEAPYGEQNDVLVDIATDIYYHSDFDPDESKKEDIIVEILFIMLNSGLILQEIKTINN